MSTPQMPKSPGQTPGSSEMSWGEGMFPDEAKNFAGIAPGTDVTDDYDQYRSAVAERRTDSTDPTSVASLADKGNPDRFGGQPALVRDTAPLPASKIDPLAPGGVRGRAPKTGVERAN